MEGSEHDKTFLFRHKIVVVNLFLMVFILGFDPDILSLLPQTVAADYYVGVAIIASMFLELAGIWFTARMVFSHGQALYQKVPIWILLTFFPRVAVSGAIATLAIDAMRGFHFTEFFLVPIVLYAAVKEFWARMVLLNTEREKTIRPTRLQSILGDFSLVAFILVSYLAIWKVYLLETPRLMYQVMSPVNWGFDALAMAVVIYALEMPLFWEDHLKPKTQSQRLASYWSLLLPVVGLVGRLFLQSYLRS
jgi:hypothetical protein